VIHWCLQTPPHQLSPVSVANASARQQQSSEHQRIRIHNPLKTSGCCVEFALQGGERHVDNEVVNNHKKNADAEDGQDKPTLGVDTVGGC